VPEGLAVPIEEATKTHRHRRCGGRRWSYRAPRRRSRRRSGASGWGAAGGGWFWSPGHRRRGPSGSITCVCDDDDGFRAGNRGWDDRATTPRISARSTASLCRSRQRSPVIESIPRKRHGPYPGGRSAEPTVI